MRQNNMKSKFCVVFYIDDKSVALVDQGIIRHNRLSPHSHYILDYTDKKTGSTTPHDVHVWSIHNRSQYKESRLIEKQLIEVLKYKGPSGIGGCVLCGLHELLENTGYSLDAYVKSGQNRKRSGIKEIPCRNADGKTMPCSTSEQDSMLPKRRAYAVNMAENSTSADVTNIEAESEESPVDDSSDDIFMAALNTPCNCEIGDKVNNIIDQNSALQSKLETIIGQNERLLKQNVALATTCRALEQTCGTLRSAVANFGGLANNWSRVMSSVFDLTTQIAKHVEATNATINERKYQSEKRQASADAGSSITPTSSPLTPVQHAFNENLLQGVGDRHIGALREATARYILTDFDQDQIEICKEPLVSTSLEGYAKLLRAYRDPQRFFLQLLKKVMIDEQGIDVRGYTNSGHGSDKQALFKNRVFAGLMHQMKRQHPTYQITPERAKSITDWCGRQPLS